MLLSSGLNRAAAAQPADDGVKPFVKCWSKGVNELGDAGLAADSDKGYFVSGDGTMNAIEIANGNTVWATELGGKVGSDILVSPQAVYIVSNGKPDGSVLRSLSSSTGITNWSIDLPPGERFFLGRTNAGIAAISSDGFVIAIREAGGAVVWKGLIKDGLSSTPQFQPTAIIGSTSGKKIVVISAADGKVTESADSSGFVTAAIAPVSPSIYISSDQSGTVFSVDFPAGGTNWKYRAGGKITSLLSFEDRILAGSNDNFVYALESGSGNLLWKRRMPGRIAMSGKISNELAAFTIYGENTAYFLDPRNGKIANQITLTGDNAFLNTPIKANGSFILVATVGGLSAYSQGSCTNEKNGK